jgi:hypothetical protein
MEADDAGAGVAGGGFDDVEGVAEGGRKGGIGADLGALIDLGLLVGAFEVHGSAFGGLAEDFDGVGEEIDVEASEFFSAARAGEGDEVGECVGGEHGEGKG